MTANPTIFISYSSVDVKYARIVRNLFEDLGYMSSLFELKQELSDDLLRLLLSNEIQARDQVVVLVSEDAKKSLWVDFEIEFTNKYFKPMYCIDLENCAKKIAPDQLINDCLKSTVKKIGGEIGKKDVVISFSDSGTIISLINSKELTSANKNIFISSSPKDKPLADIFRKAFQTLGYNVFTDIDAIRVGEAWQGAIEREINNADQILVILTSNRFSPNDRIWKEIEVAHQLNKPVIKIPLEYGFGNMELNIAPNLLREQSCW